VIIIPQELEAAMSMQAQAGREGKERKGHIRRVRSPGRKAVWRGIQGVYTDNNPVAYSLRQSNMLYIYESIKVQGNTIVMIPSESLNSMGFGNLGMTPAYLENTKKAAAKTTMIAKEGNA
jgi:hypothetical protein